MKQEFEMLQSEMDDIISINKDMPPVMKFGDYWSGMDLSAKVNHYWEVLGDKYGFKSMSVEPSSRGNLFFLAEPKPIVDPNEKKRYYELDYGEMNLISQDIDPILETIKVHIQDLKDDDDFQCTIGVKRLTQQEIEDLPDHE